MRFRSVLVALLSGNVLLTVANLVRDVVLASSFGAARESDVLFLAISIPVFLISVGANAFRSVSVPALSKALNLSTAVGQAISQRFLQVGNRSAIGVATTVLAAALIVYGIEILPIDADGRKLFALVLAAIAPMYLLSGQIEIWQGPLQAWGKYLGPSLLRLGLPCGIAIGVLSMPSASVFAVAAGGTVGALIAWACGVMLLHALGLRPGLRTNPLPADVRASAMSGYAALVAATCITYANPLVDQWIAGMAGEGSISMLGYANRITTGIANLAAGALSQALLVRYSRLVGASDMAGIRDTFSRVIRVAPWAGCFVTLGVWLTSHLAVSLLYERGSFDAATTTRVATLVNVYAMQFPIYWTSAASFTLVSAAFMNRVFLPIGVILFAVNLACDLLFLRFFGLAGIAGTTSVVYLVSMGLLNLALAKSGYIRMTSRDTFALLAPFALLAGCGILIYRFRLSISMDGDLVATTWSLAMLAGFAAIGAFQARKSLEVRQESV